MNIDKNRIVIKIFRRYSNHGSVGFRAGFYRNNLEYSEHKTQAIAAMGYDIASIVKECHKNDTSATVEFPRAIYEINCPADIRAAMFYEPVSEAEIRVFWNRFCKGLSLKD